METQNVWSCICSPVRMAGSTMSCTGPHKFRLVGERYERSGFEIAPELSKITRWGICKLRSDVVVFVNSHEEWGSSHARPCSASTQTAADEASPSMMLDQINLLTPTSTSYYLFLGHDVEGTCVVLGCDEADMDGSKYLNAEKAYELPCI